MQDRWVYLVSVSKKTLSLGQLLLIHLLQTWNSTLVVLCYVNAFKETESTNAFLFVACFLGTRPAVEKLILYPFHLLPPASPSSVCGVLLSSFGFCCCLGVFLFGWFCR